MYRKILQRSPAIRSANIIIIDDSDISRYLVKSFFSGAGFTNLFFAENGQEALDNIGSINPDIVITDLLMPKMSGHEFIKKLREIKEYDHIPIIVQTASTELEERNEAFENGASDVITKPLQREELLSRVAFHLENVLFRKRVEKELESARELQFSMLPDEADVKSVETKYNIDVASCFMPSSELGGDFWGFKKISLSELSIYMVDVSGHGVAAALNTFRIQSLLNSPNSFLSSTSIFLKKLNRRMFGLLPVGQFSTMFYGVINLGDNMLYYSSAASLGGVIIKKNGNVLPLNANGAPLGVSIDADYETHQASYEKGDTIVLYSDALVESANDENKFLSQEEISDILSQSKELPAAKILENLTYAFRAHTGKSPVEDDLTINVYKRS